MTHALTVRGRPVGHHGPEPYLVAELGVSAANMKEALQLLDVAAAAGFDAVKFQYHRQDEANWELIPPEARESIQASIAWQGAPTIEALIDEARDRGLAAGVTCFDPVGFRQLAKWDSPPDFIKIGSAEATAWRHVSSAAAVACQLKIPLVMSTGCGIDTKTITVARPAPLVLLWCCSFYPCNQFTDEQDLAALRFWGDVVGVSDHAPSGRGSGRAAVGAGAAWIERHLVPDSAAPDADVGLHIDIAAEWVAMAQEARPYREHAVWWAQPGWWWARPRKAGETVGDGVTAKRPCIGLPAAAGVHGRSVTRDVKAGEPVRWQDFL